MHTSATLPPHTEKSPFLKYHSNEYGLSLAANGSVSRELIFLGVGCGYGLSVCLHHIQTGKWHRTFFTKMGVASKTCSLACCHLLSSEEREGEGRRVLHHGEPLSECGGKYKCPNTPSNCQKSCEIMSTLVGHVETWAMLNIQLIYCCNRYTYCSTSAVNFTDYYILVTACLCNKSGP